MLWKAHLVPERKEWSPVARRTNRLVWFLFVPVVVLYLPFCSLASEFPRYIYDILLSLIIGQQDIVLYHFIKKYCFVILIWVTAVISHLWIFFFVNFHWLMSSSKVEDLVTSCYFCQLLVWHLKMLKCCALLSCWCVLWVIHPFF